MSNLTAFKHFDFRLYFAGQSVSYTGNKLQLAALAWHAYDLTHDPLALGLIGFWRFLPLALLALWGGTVVDRARDQRWVMLICQVIMGSMSIYLAYLTWSGDVTTQHLYLIAGVTAAATAFDIPAKQAILPALVPRESLGSAIRLNALASTTAEILGPALFGLLIHFGSMGMVYLINGVSFIGVIIALLLMRARPQGDRSRGSGWLMLRQGVSFVRRTPVLWGILALDFSASFFASGVTLLPIVARELLGGDVGVYSTLTSSMAVGAVSATLILTFMKARLRPGQAIIYAVGGYGIATAGLGLSSSIPLSVIFAGLIGAGEITSRVLRDTLRQLITPDPLRGRVGALNTLTSKSGPRLGELEAGWVAHLTSTSTSLISGGALCCLIALGFAKLHRPLWEIEEEPSALDD